MEKMVRTNIYLTARQHKAIAKEAKRLSLTAAEVLRRIVDEWLDGRTGRPLKLVGGQ
jgi:hypothetical protein